MFNIGEVKVQNFVSFLNLFSLTIYIYLSNKNITNNINNMVIFKWANFEQFKFHDNKPYSNNVSKSYLNSRAEKMFSRNQNLNLRLLEM